MARLCGLRQNSFAQSCNACERFDSTRDRLRCDTSHSPRRAPQWRVNAGKNIFRFGAFRGRRGPIRKSAGIRRMGRSGRRRCVSRVIRDDIRHVDRPSFAAIAMTIRTSSRASITLASNSIPTHRSRCAVERVVSGIALRALREWRRRRWWRPRLRADQSGCCGGSASAGDTCNCSCVAGAPSIPGH